ncbi:GAF domain-containing protein [Streptomyces sp. NPDC003660]
MSHFQPGTNFYPGQQPDAATRPLPRRSGRTLTVPAPGAPPFLAAPDAPPAPSEAEVRDALIHRLGLPTSAHDDFDAIARDLAEKTGFAYGFVNPFLGDRQVFIGLHQPAAGTGYVHVGRSMSLDHGWCPEVVARKRPLPLPDVHASPRFASNPVVDAVGIRSYFGAPLIHDSGTVLGTVCVIDPDPRPLTDALRIQEFVVGTAHQVMAPINGALPH